MALLSLKAKGQPKTSSKIVASPVDLGTSGTSPIDILTFRFSKHLHYTTIFIRIRNVLDLQSKFDQFSRKGFRLKSLWFPDPVSILLSMRNLNLVIYKEKLRLTLIQLYLPTIRLLLSDNSMVRSSAGTVELIHHSQKHNFAWDKKAYSLIPRHSLW